MHLSRVNNIRMEIAAIIRANTFHGTTRSCLEITEKFMSTQLVVRSLENHGLRALSRAHRRVNAPKRVERPRIRRDGRYDSPGDWERLNWNNAEQLQYGSGPQIFTEGTFIVWDVDIREMDILSIRDYLDEHEDVVKHKFIEGYMIDGQVDCNGIEEIDYEQLAHEYAQSYQQRLIPFRGYAGSLISGGSKVPKFDINKQGARKPDPRTGKLPNPEVWDRQSHWGRGCEPGERWDMDDILPTVI